ncbi:hypothetical protein NLX67_16485 [Domibacillus sp. A3M-37]|uniref:hypothetical protein n=1 Tax=Domibacillus sp. A3M-37 TaxID=2962037 RepID=UPI0020B700E0|nr:hypothetical protein [Domibacillus sp. A3M-37]MCP3763964.1 hypothetical protein [Domibacillus sp. A3M-37]
MKQKGLRFPRAVREPPRCSRSCGVSRSPLLRGLTFTAVPAGVCVLFASHHFLKELRMFVPFFGWLLFTKTNGAS